MAQKKPKGHNLPESADEHDRKLLSDVEQYGWHVIGVEEDAEGSAFSYSIGLHHTFGHAEVIVFGPPVRVIHQIINGIGEEIRSGKKFGHLDESGDVLDGYNVCFRTVEKRHYRDYFGYAEWFYRGDGFPALQCVWPDSSHRYPWHPGADPDLPRRQPVLSDDKYWPFHEGKNRAVFTTRPVLEDKLPILLVSHDSEGDWQFLCGTTNHTKDAKIVSLGCIFERDPTLAAVADMPEGWKADRQGVGASWRRMKGQKD